MNIQSLEDAKAGLARGCREFVIDRRSANNSGGDSYLRAAEDFMIISFLSDMEVDARIEADRETVYMLSGIRKSYYDFLMEMDGQKQSEPEDAVGKFAVPYSENASFAVLSWDERSEGVSVENAAPELADAVLTHSYPIHTGFAFRDGKDAIVSVKRGRLLIIVSRKFTSNPR